MHIDWFWLAVMTPIVFGIGAGMFAAYLSHRRKELLLKNLHTERMTALEKGLPPLEWPPSLLEDFSAPNAVVSMRNGIGLALIGVVLYFAVRQFIDEDMALFGLIPTAIGVANLVYAAVLWRRADETPRTSARS
jgi:hypothetical protein